MKRLNLLKVSCAEAASLCHKAEYKEASFKEKLRLKLHIFLCKTCKDYQHNNKKLSSLLKKADLKSCSHREKENFREKIKNGNSKASEK
jgi:hypothetical protein